MTDPYLFERGIGQQMGDLCRLAVGEAKVTQTGEIVTLEEMLGRGAFGVSVEVPYTSGGVSAVKVTRCGKNLFNIASLPFYNSNYINWQTGNMIHWGASWKASRFVSIKPTVRYTLSAYGSGVASAGYAFYNAAQEYISGATMNNKGEYHTFITPDAAVFFKFSVADSGGGYIPPSKSQLELGSTATTYEPYNGDTYTIALPADFYGGSIDLTTGTVTSIYAADGSLLAEPVVTEIDPVSIPILAGVNNIWADVGEVTVSYYAADAQTFRPALWYPTIYRGLTSARYIIKRASGAVASVSDAVAAPLVGLRVALPYDAEGYQSVSVTVNGTLTTITLPTTIYGGYLDVVTGQLVATHDENGNALANQKLYFLDPVNVSALAGINNIWADVGTVTVSYRVEP